jgi:signal peptidase I
MIAAWLAFAPTQVGGLASYSIVVGNSMEPKFHIGDLVITHQQPDYRAGDAIVYRNQEFKSFVFHRVISRRLGRYTLKGDNNSWLDTYKPSQAEVIGKLWLHIPRGGTVIRNMRDPHVMASIAGALGAILGTSLLRSKTKGKRPMHRKPFQEHFTALTQKIRDRFSDMDSPASKKPSLFRQGEILEGSFFALGVVALASLILGMIVFSRPATRIVQDDLSYQHLGVFSYSASAPQGVYDTDSIKGGDPIFTKLTCSVDVVFQYTLIASQAENITGTYQLTAIVSEPVSGWRRTVPLQEQASFTGTAFGTNARLDLCRISSLTQSMEQETGFHPGTYTLAITPNVKFDGNLSKRALKGLFNSGLTFRYDQVQFYLLQTEEQENLLALTETVVLPEERKQANTLLLLGRELSIPRLRGVTLVSFIASLSGLLLLGLRLQNLSYFDQEKYYRIKYDSIMIDIQNTDSLRPARPIDVASMEALAKLAERFNTMILHATENNLHTYYVQNSGRTYQFRLHAELTGSASREEAIRQEHGT